MQRIEDHLKGTDSYKKLGYTIRDLSTETDIPCYLVSQVINQEYDMNFNELINAYRVQYLARVFKTSPDWQSYTLEAMGRMAGFNSRTAFIAAIKKHTGMTPSAFFGRRESDNTEHQIFSNPERMRDVA
jgi:AraC-like DNA-binding protein